MKQSMYNFFVDSEEHNEILLYNSFTNALGVLSKEEYHLLNQKLKDKAYDSIDTDLYSTLVAQGFLVEDDLNEIEIIECNALNNKYMDRILSLTIAPTQDCNFRCVYCYEKENLSKKYMNSETMDNLISFIERRMKGIFQLNIVWYGGEPLLNIDIIDSLTKRILELCEKNNVKYQAGIVTNGYLLGEKELEILTRYKINTAQITLDGDKFTHDSRRFLEGGTGTFDTIINNLKNIIEKNLELKVSLRVNVDKTNIDQVHNVSNIIREFDKDKRIYIYLGQVVGTNGCYNKSKCLDTKEYSIKSFDFLLNTGHDEEKLYPMPKTGACGADCVSSIVIDAEGYLYKCWEDIGNISMSIGTIKTDIYFNNKNNLFYMKNNETREKTCLIVKYFHCVWVAV